jgi:hypothetical protein
VKTGWAGAYPVFVVLGLVENAIGAIRFGIGFPRELKGCGKLWIWGENGEKDT